MGIRCTSVNYFDYAAELTDSDFTQPCRNNGYLAGVKSVEKQAMLKHPTRKRIVDVLNSAVVNSFVNIGPQMTATNFKNNTL
jgi:hypothetical protein